MHNKTDLKENKFYKNLSMIFSSYRMNDYIYGSINLSEETDPLAKQYGTRSLSSMTW